MSAAPQPQPLAADEPDGRWLTLRRNLADRPEISLVVLLVILMTVTHLVSETGFYSLNQLSTTLRIAAPLAIIAAGQTLVMLTAGIDLSVANTATAGGFVMASYAHEGTARAVAIGLGVGLAIGLFNGIGVALFRVNPLIMTLGTATILIGALAVYAQTYATGAPDVPSAVSELGGGRVFTYVPTSLFLLVPLSLVIILGLRYSGIGRMIYAIGDNPRACRLAGVRVWQVQVFVYAASGLLAALAGIVLAGLIGNVSPSLAGSYLLPSVAAVVIGGTSIFGGVGGYLGTLLGALILTVLDALLILLDTSEELRTILYGVIILSLAWLYSKLSAGA